MGKGQKEDRLARPIGRDEATCFATSKPIPISLLAIESSFPEPNAMQSRADLRISSRLLTLAEPVMVDRLVPTPATSFLSLFFLSLFDQFRRKFPWSGTTGVQGKSGRSV